MHFYDSQIFSISSIVMARPFSDATHVDLPVDNHPFSIEVDDFIFDFDFTKTEGIVNILRYSFSSSIVSNSSLYKLG